VLLASGIGVLQRAWPAGNSPARGELVEPRAATRPSAGSGRAGIDARLAKLRQFKHFLDEAYRVPGTNIRFGWDALIGVVPWVGDLTTALMSCAIIVQAHSMGVPRVVQVRMLINIIVDLFVGFVPLFGDVADVFWKSNSMNFVLLERHLGEVPADTRGDWLFVGSAIAIVLLVAIVPLVMMYWIVHSLMTSGIHSPFF